MAKGDTKQKEGKASGAHWRISNAGDRIGGTLESAPLVALAAGAVVGAVAGALLPRTERETEILGPVGSKLGQAAAEAAKAARDAGKQEFGLLAGEQSPVHALVEKAIGAVGAAGSAAASSVTRKQGG